jgi:hypothetical protein
MLRGDPAIKGHRARELSARPLCHCVDCKSIEDMAAAQGAASTCLHAGDIPIGEELFRQAARLHTKRAQYQPGLYTNPFQKAGGSVSAINESFERHRATHVGVLQTRDLEDASREEPRHAQTGYPSRSA